MESRVLELSPPFSTVIEEYEFLAVFGVTKRRQWPWRFSGETLSPSLRNVLLVRTF